MKNSNGFLIVDIAFSLLVISFAFVLILYAQQHITKELNIDDIKNLYKSNNELFTNIKQDKCKKDTIKTKNNFLYNVCLVEGNKNGIVFRYYVIRK